MKLTIFIPIGLFAIWYILKFGHMELDQSIAWWLMGSLALGTIVSGIIVGVDYIKTFIKSRKTNRAEIRS